MFLISALQRVEEHRAASNIADLLLKLYAENIGDISNTV